MLPTLVPCIDLSEGVSRFNEIETNCRGTSKSKQHRFPSIRIPGSDPQLAKGTAKLPMTKTNWRWAQIFHYKYL